MENWSCRCGKENGAGAQFCSRCGRLRSTLAAKGRGAPPAPSGPEPPEPLVRYERMPRSEMPSPSWSPTPPASAEPETPPPAGGPRRRWRLLALALVLIAGGVTAVVANGDSGDDAASRSASTAAPATLPASTLDATVERLRVYVEQARGLKFKAPVKVDVLADDEFEARLQSGATVDQTDLEGSVATLRALKMLPPDFDLQAEKAASVEGVLGFYDHRTKELYVRGGGDTPFVRYVLVHELTHALQDQNFGLGHLDAIEGDVALGYRAVVEGDAEFVMGGYLSTLSSFEHDIIGREARRRDIDLYNSGFYLSYTSFPYLAGRDFVRALREDGGQAALDQAFRSPPQSSEQILDPSRYPGDPPKVVARPSPGGAAVDEGEWGQFELAYLLFQFVDDQTATAAIVGWGGSRYVTWTDGARQCTRLSIVGDSGADSAELAQALHQWAAGHGDARVSGGGPVTVTACA